MTDGSQPRKALIVAVGSYDNAGLSDLPGAAIDAREMVRVLRDPAIGGFDVSVSIDETFTEIAGQVSEFFLKASLNDLLLLHLSCHGERDYRGGLAFLARNSVPGRRHTHIQSSDIADWMVGSSRQIVLTLDCCYSGAFGMRARSPESGDILGRLRGKGRFILASSSSIEWSFEDGPGLFTGAIVHGLESGEADVARRGFVSVFDLFSYVQHRMEGERRPQTPTFSADRAEGIIRLANNPRFPAEAESETLRREPGSRLLPPAPEPGDTSPGSPDALFEEYRRKLSRRVLVPRSEARQAIGRYLQDRDSEVRNRAARIWYEFRLGPTPDQLAGRVQGSCRTIAMLLGTTSVTVGCHGAHGRTTVQFIPAANGAVKRRRSTGPDGRWRVPTKRELVRLRKDAEAFTREKVDDVVFTVPIEVTRAQRETLGQTARAAGFTGVHLVSEPTALALACSDLGGTGEGGVLVLALRESSLLVSIVELKQDGYEVRASRRNPGLGGSSWDAEIVPYLKQRVREISGNLSWNKELIAHLRKQGKDVGDEAPPNEDVLYAVAEEAKIRLSDSEATEILVPSHEVRTEKYPEVVRMPPARNVPPSATLWMKTAQFPGAVWEMSREHFESLTSRLLRDCQETVRETMAEAGIGPDEIASAVMIGWPTRMPAIRRLVAEATGGAVIEESLIADGSARGAVLQAGAIEAARAARKNPVDLGVETLGGGLRTVIPARTTLPASRSATFSTGADGQETVVFRICEGDVAVGCRAELPLAGIRPAVRGTPRLEVTFELTREGELTVRARDEVSGHQVELVVGARPGLPKARGFQSARLLPVESGKPG